MHSFEEMLGETTNCSRGSLKIRGHTPARDITGKDDDDDNNNNNKKCAGRFLIYDCVVMYG